MKQLLAVLPGTGELLVTKWTKRTVRVPLFSTIRVRPSHAFEPVDEEALDRLGKLWHYDPWWVLTKEPFADHEAAPELQATNAAGVTAGTVDMIYFRRDLSRITTYVKGSDLARWRGEMLPMKSPRTPPRAKAKSRWILDPFWEQRPKLVKGEAR